MTGYDVHMDKAIKELHARLDQAERERGEANERHAALAEHVVACLPYEAETDGEALDAWECVDAASREIARLRRERDEARAALAKAEEQIEYLRHDVRMVEGERDDALNQVDDALNQVDAEPARIAAEVEARDVAWLDLLNRCFAASRRSVPEEVLDTVAAALGVSMRSAMMLCDGTPGSDETYAAAIRAARGAR